MDRIRRDSITDQVYQILHRAIAMGRFRPGARIVEETLADELGISKTPLRLALHQLKRDGVIRIEPRKGVYLAAPTLSEVIELIELREVLEGFAARRAALQADKQFVDRMESCLAGFDESNLAARRLKYAAADHRFHTILVQASGSSELIKTLQVVNIRLHQHRIGNHGGGHDLRPIHRQHLGIVKALRAGDAARSEELVRAHVRHQLALKMLKASEAKGEAAEAAGKPAASAASAANRGSLLPKVFRSSQSTPRTLRRNVRQ
jgi:DNA-binding GntR family transcriptional regulator